MSQGKKQVSQVPYPETAQPHLPTVVLAVVVSHLVVEVVKSAVR